MNSLKRLPKSKLNLNIIILPLTFCWLFFDIPILGVLVKSFYVFVSVLLFLFFIPATIFVYSKFFQRLYFESRKKEGRPSLLYEKKDFPYNLIIQICIISMLFSYGLFFWGCLITFTIILAKLTNKCFDYRIKELEKLYEEYGHYPEKI